MPKYNFTWNNFDEETINSFAKATGYIKNSNQTALEYLKEKVKRPNEKFVKDYKDVIIDNWLANQESGGKYLNQITDRLVNLKLGPQNRNSKSDHLSFIQKTRNTKNFQKVIKECLINYGTPEYEAKFLKSVIPPFVIIDPSEQSTDRRKKPHYFQENQWKKLTLLYNHSNITGKFAALLVMPTGSGKTFTAVHWLMKNFVNYRHKVIWIAHRHELLDQAALAFREAAYLANGIKSSIRIRIVSGKHKSAKTIKPTDDIILAMANISRNENTIKEIFDDSSNILVIDEAHHAPANTYKKLIVYLKEQNKYNLLGLTATPTRTADYEKTILSNLFDNQAISTVTNGELIKNGYLAYPIPIIEKTNYSIEDSADKEDFNFLLSKHDLSPKWKEKVASLASRNERIVEHYKKKKKKYGKTIIFAINVLHAEKLKERFEKENIESESITSYQLDDRELDKTEVIERFRDRKSGLDILINVQILTEGVDIPEIDTVFLTRPTSSEILLRQMIGRGLRGIRAGGTEKVYIVSFEDHWTHLGNLMMNPLDKVDDIFPEKEKQTISENKLVKKLTATIPWQVINDIFKAFNRKTELLTDVFEAIPVGWYSIELEEDEINVNDTFINVLEHQKIWWEAFINFLFKLPNSKLNTINIVEIYDDFFEDCNIPQPGMNDAGLMLKYIKSFRKKPDFFNIQEREVCNPMRIASEIVNKKLNKKEKETLIKSSYKNPLAKVAFSNAKDLQTAIEEEIIALENPNHKNKHSYAEPILEDLPFDTLTPYNYDIEELYNSVLIQGKKLLGKDLPNFTEIYWTKKIIKGYYGVCFQGGKVGEGKIKINLMLNSKEVPKEVIRFVMWHEYLHAYLPFEKHSRKFRNLEKLWPSHDESYNFLYGLDEQYFIQYL